MASYETPPIFSDWLGVWIYHGMGAAWLAWGEIATGNWRRHYHGIAPHTHRIVREGSA